MTKINENNIIKFLSGQASLEEANKILHWKNSNDENKKTYKEIEAAFNTSEIVMNPEKFDAFGAYSIVKLKLQKSKVVSFRRSKLKQFVGYAATAIIAIGLTWFSQKHFLAEDVPMQAAEAYQSVETPSGAKSLITLEDGTKIWLNAKSKLTYPAHFVDNKRVVTLEGEGYFEVAKDKSRPFEVKTSNLNIQVLGTVFNLKSYPEEGLVETTLIEGRVALNKITNEKEQEIYQLKPNQQALFIKKEGFLTTNEMAAANLSNDESNTRSSEKLVVNDIVDIDAVTAWKDGNMIFKNETFESIAIKLERRYNAKIVFQDEAVKSYRFSGKFDEISIEQALKALQFASTFSYKIEQDKIIIKE